MKEFQNFLDSAEIDKEYHSKVFESDEFERFLSKIDLELYEKIKNRIYWLSLLIFRISIKNYLENINIESSKMTIKKNNLILFHSFCIISSEFCKQFSNKYVCISLVSTLCRQIIEQICIIKEIELKKIDEARIVEASIESYNMHLGSDSINSNKLNKDNVGLLKVFDNKISYGLLAKKYKYGYMYNLFSGDIHTLSQIEKILPLNKNRTYNEIYLQCVLTLLKEVLLILKEYDSTNLEINLNELDKIDFLEIKSNKKGKK